MMMNTKNSIQNSMLILLVVMGIIVSSCGYRMIGSTFLPFDTITISHVRNSTYEPLLDESLHFALSSEFISQGIEVLPAGGDAVLKVNVTEFRLNAIGVVDEKVQEQELSVSIDAELIDEKETVKFMSVTSPISITFQVSGTVGESIVNKERAIDRDAREIAKEIVSRIMTRYAE